MTSLLRAANDLPFVLLYKLGSGHLCHYSSVLSFRLGKTSYQLSNLDTCVPSMTQMRELETTHHEKVTEIAINHLERFVKNQVEEELPDELRLVRVACDW